MKLAIAASIVLGAAPAAASANTTGWSVSDLVAMCRGMPDEITQAPSDQGLCIGYMHGFAGGYSVGLNTSPGDNRICLPVGVSTLQWSRIFLKWADQNPEGLHWPAAIGVLAAMSTAFPCQQAP